MRDREIRSSLPVDKLTCARCRLRNFYSEILIMVTIGYIHNMGVMLCCYDVMECFDVNANFDKNSSNILIFVY